MFMPKSDRLLGYACYEQPDGSILGDPKNLAFTREALKLGWQGPGTRFDLLPWIIQKRGEAPRLYPPPMAKALEVSLEHPELPWFSDLGLKWYAVPVLSDMVLRIGGVDFPAAPFNGWYMGTEIGSRDLGDSGRYDALPQIADRMGLDRSRDSSLWKDRALVELNAAVLHSCAKAGVADKSKAKPRTGRSMVRMEYPLVVKTSGSACIALPAFLFPTSGGDVVMTMTRT